MKYKKKFKKSKPREFVKKDIVFTQNFIFDKKLVSQIVGLSNIKSGSTVLEIGPGKGIITEELASVVGENGKVVAIELDGKLASDLMVKFQHTKQVEIIKANILDYNIRTVGKKFTVFANIPFNITSEIFNLLFNHNTIVDNAYLIIEREVLIGGKEAYETNETLKSLFIKPYFEIKCIHNFAKSDFQPKPSVDTGLFYFEKKDEPDVKDHYLYKDFITTISRDRIGEGSWIKLFTKKQLGIIAKNPKLRFTKGLKYQSYEGILEIFNVFERYNKDLHDLVAGAFRGLKKEQKKRIFTAKKGGHKRWNRNNKGGRR